MENPSEIYLNEGKSMSLHLLLNCLYKQFHLTTNNISTYGVYEYFELLSLYCYIAIWIDIIHKEK